MVQRKLEIAIKPQDKDKEARKNESSPSALGISRIVLPTCDCSCPLCQWGEHCGNKHKGCNMPTWMR